MTNGSTNSTKLITSNDPTTINKDRVIDPNINTSYTTGPASLNEFNTHNEITTENIANDQPSVLNSDLNQPTENIINTFHIPRTTPLNESGMHNESVFVVNDQLSGSNDQLGAPNADPVNSTKLTEVIDLNKASKIKPTTTGSVTGRFNRPFSKCPKHLTPCPFLRKRRFCKKGNNCDFLHESRQFHDNMQRPFFNTIHQAAPLPRFHYPPFPVNPGYFPPFRFPTHHPTSLSPPYTLLHCVSTNETSNSLLTNRINKGSTRIKIPVGASSKNSVCPTKSSPNHFVPSIVVSNVMSLAPKIDEINYFMSTERPDIACFTETWLKDSIDDNVIDISDYSVVCKNRSHAQHGGVCMYIKNGLKFSKLHEYEYNTSNEVLWCKLQPHRLPRGYSCLIIAVVYHPPTSDDEYLNSYLLDTLGIIESSFPQAAVIITGDFNRLNISHLKCQFQLKQLINFPTRGEAILDLILTNLKHFYQVPTRLARFGLSDHYTISLIPKERKKTISTNKTVTVRDMRPSKKQALGRFLHSIEWTILESMNNMDMKATYFNDIIQTGLNTLMPTKSVKLHSNDAPWMTGHLKLLIRQRQKALNEKNTHLFRFYRNKVNRERKLCREKYYQVKVKKLNNQDPKKWWNECKRLCGMSNPKKNILAKLLPEGSQTLEEKTNLANKINSIFLEPQQAYEPLNKNKRLDFTNAMPPIITTETVFSLLNKININKSNGPDNIPNWVLKEYASNLAVPVTSLINSSLNEQTLPQIWKSADVTPIPKNSQVESISNDLKPIYL